MSAVSVFLDRPWGGARGGIGLHLRGRRAGAAFGGLVLTAILARGLVARLPELAGVVLTTLAPLVAVSLLGPTLAGDDPELERTAARLTARWRIRHLVLAAVCAAAVLGAAGAGPLRAPELEAAGRNLLGFSGLIALGATAVGVRLAWTPPCAWGLLAIPAGAQSEWLRATLAWPAQPPATGPTIIALVLGVAGAGAYARRSPHL